MNSTRETYAAGFARLDSNDAQRAAVAKYLGKHGEISRDYAYNIGLPECGRIKNLGGRIHEMRADGWNIETDMRNGICWYVLIAKPGDMNRPKILIMGEEVPYDAIPEAKETDIRQHFKPVKLSPKAIDQASKIVPFDAWKNVGIHTWLSRAADHVFSKLTSDQTEARFGVMKYKFEFAADGPLLVTVTL